MDNFREHAVASWSEILNEMVTEITKQNNIFDVKTSSGKHFSAKYVILATGNNHKKLWCVWEKEFLWKWVSYCATCDGMFFKNREVIVVWWGNTALTESIYLSEICKKVYLIHRRNEFRAENTWIEQAKKRENIEFILNDEVEEIVWDKLWMTWVKLKSWKEVKSDWIFVAVWTSPNTSLVDGLNPQKDEEWCLIVDKRQETSVKWLYAAWDVTTNSNKFKQTIMSAAEWCLAANSVHEDKMR